MHDTENLRTFISLNMPIAKKIQHQFLWRGLVLFTQLVIHLFLARILGPAESGRFFLLINNLALAILLFGFSLEGAAIYYASRENDNKNQLASALFLWAVLMGALMLVFSWYPGIPSFNGLHPLWLALYLFSFLLINGFTGLYQAEGDFKKYNQVIVGVNTLYALLLGYIYKSLQADEGMAAHFTGIYGHAVIFYGYFVVVVLQAIAITLMYWIRLNPPRWASPGFSLYRKLLHYGGLAVISNLVFFLINRADYWMVDHFCSPNDLGVYIQVTKLTQMLVLPGVFLSAILLPQTARDNRLLRQPVFKRLLRYYMIGNLFLLGFIALTGRFWIETMWGAAYRSIYAPLMLALPGVFFLGLCYLFSPVMAGLGKVSINIWTGTVTLVTVVVVDLFLIPRWGILGAATGSSVAFMVMLAIYVIIAMKMGLRFSSTVFSED